MDSFISPSWCHLAEIILSCSFRRGFHGPSPDKFMFYTDCRDDENFALKKLLGWMYWRKEFEERKGTVFSWFSSEMKRQLTERAKTQQIPLPCLTQNSQNWHRFTQIFSLLTREDTRAELDTLGTLSTMACFMYLSMAWSIVPWQREKGEKGKWGGFGGRASKQQEAKIHTQRSLGENLELILQGRWGVELSGPKGSGTKSPAEQS